METRAHAVDPADASTSLRLLPIQPQQSASSTMSFLRITVEVLCKRSSLRSQSMWCLRTVRRPGIRNGFLAPRGKRIDRRGDSHLLKT